MVFWMSVMFLSVLHVISSLLLTPIYVLTYLFLWICVLTFGGRDCGTSRAPCTARSRARAGAAAAATSSTHPARASEGNNNQEVKVYTWRVCLSLSLYVLFLKTQSSTDNSMGDSARTKRREQLKRWAGSCTDKASAVPRRRWRWDAEDGAGEPEAELRDPTTEQSLSTTDESSPLSKRRSEMSS